MKVTEKDLREIQGLAVRSYKHHRFARYFVVSVTQPMSARRLLGRLASGDEPRNLQITSAEWWGENRPQSTLNVTITYAGLERLGVPQHYLDVFPGEFRQGAIQRASRIYDCDESAPSRWWGGMNQEANVHLIFSLYSMSPAVLEQRTADLRDLYENGFSETYSHDAAALDGAFVHFGYKDGISQPHIEGVQKKSLAYPLSPLPAGDFILGYRSSFGWEHFPELAHSILGRNGSFGAFRILEQDVMGFESFLKEAAPTAGMSTEMLAAKLLGRWRNGTPLVLSPNAQKAIPKEQLNLFLYKSKAGEQPEADPQGVLCPIGAHIRRANPRDQFVSGGLPQASRLMRHNLPFGPPFDPKHPHDGIQRGLIGYFINANFVVQFELVMNQWFNTNEATMGCISGKDPIVGANDPINSVFSMPTLDMPGYPRSCNQVKPQKVTSFNRFVNTRGSAYCFFPSLPALKYISSLSS